MPYISIESAYLTTEQKEELITELTNISSKIMNIPKEFFSITIKELDDSNFGIGGKSIGKIKEEYNNK